MATTVTDAPAVLVRCRHGFVTCSLCLCPGGYSIAELARWGVDIYEQKKG